MTPSAELAHDYCARPRCRALFVPDDGKGRRQRYCSAECRRAADTERKRVIARIASLERSLRLARLDLAVFGIDADEPEETPNDEA